MQTIELMCRYIRESADADPYMSEVAQYVARNFGGGSPDPSMLAWGVFWFVKHRVKFVVDESPMMRLGEQGQQDLLIAPSVLIRMDSPREDCDGFTMLVCALLRCLKIPFVIITIAASPDDPERWSHVFPMALLPAGPMALDASHGSGPGWMVPRQHTFRWQAWDAEGNPVNVPRPRPSGLHGWVRSGYGLGQDDGGDLSSLSSIPLTTGDMGDLLTNSDLVQTLELPSPPVSTTPATTSSSGFNWTSFLNNLTSQAAGVAKVAEVEGATTNASLALSGAFSSLVPLLLIGVAAFFAISLIGDARK